MAECLLDQADILGLPVELRGKYVPQHVRMHILVLEPRRFTMARKALAWMGVPLSAASRFSSTMCV